ncbi:Transporter, drug/metabolite exporter family [Roseomonas mucosa]|uniref:Multidrug transporter n=1 Tax=Roseomonas mucosa TaxID=207340 RepID=A0A1S8D8J2_9PROT|nr:MULTISPECIES: DMT family transporter [Roseomonas]ATR20745.1 EamA/RhaT family transporter [Roseomonas sp. FDAARGOS_362]AWV22732.1 Transporter, drug/metabolite exporter family [Roseomonas mucosa]MCG7353691.1 DMT family transporter [Roseomonas mucosa]MCG7357152.1 DMT family transporter [Roseomonas mucosa]MDT8276208.1 DMT family transporter [Roseomonas mucosa]
MRHDLRRGALLIVAAGLIWQLMNALVKQLGSTIPVPELMFFRNLFSLPMVLLIASRGTITLRTRRFGGHVVRASTGLVAMSLSFLAVSVLPLAEQQVLGYTQPLFITILAIPFLGEQPDRRRWLAVLVGFLGVVTVALGQGGLGGGSAPGWAYVAAVTQGLVSALTTLQIRQLSATESSSTITLWQAILMTGIMTCALPFVWVTPTWGQFGLLVLLGTLGGLAQVLQTEAFASAQVSALGPYTYCGLIWATIIGWTVFGDAPSLVMILGALLIVGAGLAILPGRARPGPVAEPRAKPSEAVAGE